MFKQETTTTKEDLLEYIFENVEELKQIPLIEEGDFYGERIWEAYLDECETQETELSPEEFVDDMYNSIGFDWVFDNE